MNARPVCRALLALWLVLGLAGAGAASTADEDADGQQRQDEEVSLPEFPREDDLLPFYVSAGTTHGYFIDAKSIGTGAGGVVRFTLVVKTSGGSTNVSHEAIRCATLEHRLYATGRAGGTWVRARGGEWKQIENKPVNGYHAALSRYYFCPAAFPIRDAEEGRKALRLGRHPDAN